MNEENIKALVDSMNKQGASQDEIQRAIDTMSSQSQTEIKEDGFTKGVIKAVANPFLKAGATIGAGIDVATSYLPGGETPDQSRQQAMEGYNIPYFGNIKPFGAEAFKELESGDISKGTFLKRVGLETAGNMAEIATWGYAPLKAIKGAGFFETAFKTGFKPSLMFGTAKALQAGGEGKEGTNVAIEGIGGFLGSSLGYGITGKAAQFIGNWGSKALQSEAVKVAGEGIKSFAEKVWTAMPKSFQKAGFNMADTIINKSTRRAVNALKSEYSTVHKQAVDSMIDSTIPNVNRPDLVLGEFQRNLSSEIGSMFRKSTSLYDEFKAANPITTSASDWSITNSVINKLSKIPNSNANYFGIGLKQSLNKPTSPRQVLSMYEQLMSDVQTATSNEEKTAIRELAQGLYSDMRGILEKNDKTLLNKWDEAYQSWKSAVDVYESNPLNQLKSTGEVDTIVDKMTSKALTRKEQQIIYDAMKNNPEPVRNLIVGSLLRKAKSVSPEEGSKLIQDFLDSWDFQVGNDTVNGFLHPNQVAYLDDLSNYMSQNFDDFTNGMRNTIGVSEETTQKLTEQKAKMNIAELVDKGNFEEIATNWSKISGKEDFAEALKTLTPSERKVVGLSIFRKMYDENTPLITLNPDGTTNLDTIVNSFKGAFSELQRVGGGKKSDLLNQLYSKEQVNDLFKANDLIQTYKDVKNIPMGDAKTILHAIVGSIYATFGRKYVGAATRHLGEAVQEPASKKQFIQAINKLIDDDMLKKNKAINLSDLIQSIQKQSGIITGEVSSEMLD